MNDITTRHMHEDDALDLTVQDILHRYPRLVGTDPDQIGASFRRVLENPDFLRALGQAHMAHADELTRYVAARKKTQP